MNKEEKALIVKQLQEKLSGSSVIYLADISNLNAGETTKLRRACYKADIKMEVVKNTLLKLAMQEVSDKSFEDLPSVLKGNTSIMLSESGSAPAKLIKEFRKKSERPLLKGAYVEESVYLGDDCLFQLASIKSKEEVIADIISLLQSPVKNVVSSLESGKSKLSGIVKTLSDK